MIMWRLIRTSCSAGAGLRALTPPHALQYWLGPSPIIFTASGVAAAFAYLAMPVARDGTEILQIWLQASLPTPMRIARPLFSCLQTVSGVSLPAQDHRQLCIQRIAKMSHQLLDPFSSSLHTMTPSVKLRRQEFCWTEAGLAAAKAERGSSLSREGLTNIDREPMFCFEARLLAGSLSMLLVATKRSWRHTVGAW